MEQVLDVYKRPYDPRHPVVCMDESPRQLIRETRLPLAAGPGAPARHDFEYERCGVCNVFMAVEPLASSGSLVEATKQRQVTNRLAVYQSRCPNQAQASIPDPYCVT